MISGTYIETDQIRTAFDDITARVGQEARRRRHPRGGVHGADGDRSSRPSREHRGAGPARCPGVGGGGGGARRPSGNLVVDGEVVETFGRSRPGRSPTRTTRFDPTEIVEGRDPRAAGEAAVLDEQRRGQRHRDRRPDRRHHAPRREAGHGHRPDRASARAAHRSGERPGSSCPSSRCRGGSTSRAGSRRSASSPTPASTPSDLSERVDAALPEAVKVQTASENAEETADEVNDQIGSFLTPALLALAGAAVLVGAFIIFNTFSITVAQRTREFALLRALGDDAGADPGRGHRRGAADRGRRLGARDRGRDRLRKLLNSLFDAAGFGIPRSDLVLAPRTDRDRARRRGRRHADRRRWSRRCARRASTPVTAMSGVAPRPVARARRIAAVARGRLVPGRRSARRQGLFGSGPASAKLGAIAVGAILDVRRRRPLGPVPGPAAGVGDRLADRAPLQDHRPAGPRERRAQPRPHGDHLGGPDGRSRPGRVRRRVRRRR